jgi:predicted DNA-binding transcriptional regulator AlpA
MTRAVARPAASANHKANDMSDEFDGLVDGLDARMDAMVAHAIADAATIQQMAADTHDMLRAARLGDPIIAPLLRAALFGAQERATSLDEAPKPVSIPDSAVIGSDDVPVLDTGKDAEPVKPIRQTRKRRPSPAGVPRQATLPLAPRLICREDAAAYASVSPNTFDAMVADGRMPNPRRLTNRRLAWDVRQLDAAIDRLPIDGDADTDTDTTTDHSWDDIDAQAKTKPAAH